MCDPGDLFGVGLGSGRAFSLLSGLEKCGDSLVSGLTHCGDLGLIAGAAVGCQNPAVAIVMNSFQVHGLHRKVTKPSTS